MSDRERRRREAQHQGSFTIREWCEHRRISESMFHKLDAQGLAPRSYYTGSRRYVSDRADDAWIRQREAENEGNDAA